MSFRLITLVILINLWSFSVLAEKPCKYTVNVTDNDTRFPNESIDKLINKLFAKTFKGFRYCPDEERNFIYVHAYKSSKSDFFRVKIDNNPSLKGWNIAVFVSKINEYKPDSSHVSIEVDDNVIYFKDGNPELTLQYSAHPKNFSKMFIEDKKLLSVRSVNNMHFFGQMSLMGVALDAAGPREALKIIQDLWSSSEYNFSQITINDKDIPTLLKQKNLEDEIEKTFRKYTIGEAFSHLLRGLDITKSKTLSFWKSFPFLQINFSQSYCDDGSSMISGSYYYWIDKIDLCMKDRMESGQSNFQTHSLITTILHELGHHFDYSLPRDVRSSFYKIGWDDYIFVWSVDKSAPIVTEYGKTDPKEDFAETFATYFMKTGNISALGYTTYSLEETIPDRNDFLNHLFSDIEQYPDSYLSVWSEKFEPVPVEK